MKKYCSGRLALFLLSVLASLALMDLSCTKKTDDKALHLALFENPKSLDPVLSSDALAAEIIGNVYETLYQYHYLKRPYTLVPLLAEKMPETSKDGLVVTIKIKPHVKFQNDPCFKDGKGRELVAQDFVYGFKRLADPKNQAEGWWIFDNKIVGFNEWREKAVREGRADYGASIDGLQTPDPYTLVLKLKKRYPQLPYVLAIVYAAPMPAEAIQKYGEEIVNHTVGTGPYVIKEYTRNSQIVFEKNNNFHGEDFPKDEGFSQNPQFKDFDYGKPLPLTDRIVVHIFLEQQPGWLNFIAGKLDQIVLPKDNYDAAVGSDHELRPELVKKGMTLLKSPSTTEWFIGFNMEDPIVGKNKNLRKAMGLAYDSKKDIDLFTNGRGIPANQILPPTIAGFNPKVPLRETNISKAKDILAKAGNPNGLGIPKLTFDVEGSSRQRQAGEFFKTQMAQIGINIDVRVNTRPQLMDLKRKGKLQIHMDGWIADYPDAENFMQLLYGPNRPPGPNNSSFNNSEFNNLYEKMAVLSSGPERQKLIDQMTAIFLEESPWIPNWIATLYLMHQGWLKNYSYSDFSYNNYKYYALDAEKKTQLHKQF